jgi:hypothetical protein
MDDASYGFGESNEHARISLSETLDRVLNKGVVVCGEVVISVADIDLVYLGLQLVLTSIDTAERTSARRDRQEPCTARSDR